MITFKFISYYKIPHINTLTNDLVLKGNKLRIQVINSYYLFFFIIYFFKRLSGRLTYSLNIQSKNSQVFTLFKSPMAQKRWAREQIFFKYYVISLSITKAFDLLTGGGQHLKILYLYKFFIFNFTYLSNNLLLLYQLLINIKIKYKLLS
jgi:hypothetical protein